MNRIISSVLILCFMLQSASCVMVSTKASEIDKAQIRAKGKFQTDRPSRVHLQDGSMVVYENGFIVIEDTIRTVGVKYDFLREKSEPVKLLALEDVAVIEKYTPDFHLGALVFGTTGAVILIFMLALILYPPQIPMPT